MGHFLMSVLAFLALVAVAAASQVTDREALLLARMDRMESLLAASNARADKLEARVEVLEHELDSLRTSRAAESQSPAYCGCNYFNSSVTVVSETGQNVDLVLGTPETGFINGVSRQHRRIQVMSCRHQHQSACQRGCAELGRADHQRLADCRVLEHRCVLRAIVV